MGRATLLFGLAFTLGALEPEGPARTPPMGVDLRNLPAASVGDGAVRRIADAIVARGLRDAGYVHVIVGDGREDKRLPDMRGVAEYLHERGLKLGVVSSPGRRTCAGNEGSWGREEADARLFASWGVDYLEYEWCSGEAINASSMSDVYAKMGRALRASGREIVYSIHPKSPSNVWEWAARAGANMWRTAPDFADDWEAFARVGFGQHGLQDYAGPGHWNNPGPLHAGLPGLNEEEQRTQVTLWAIKAAPLFLIADIRTLDPAQVGIVTHPEMTAVNQDLLGRQGYRAREELGTEIWVKPLADGEIALGLFNLSGRRTHVDVIWKELGIRGSPAVRDIWKGEDRGRVQGGFAETLMPHSSALLRVIP